jgi:sugar fermentation stimulation protein A
MRVEGTIALGRFCRRLNRFAAVVTVGRRNERVHVPNPGRMQELLTPGRPALLRRSAGAARRTRYDLIQVRAAGRWIGVDTRTPNALVRWYLAGGRLPFLPGRLEGWRSEIPFGRSRLDFQVHAAGATWLLEIKSVNLVEDGVALFPDAPTRRGARHVAELAEARRHGHRAAVCFIVQRSDATKIRPYESADPEFAAALRRAARAGVRVTGYTCRLGPKRIALYRQVPVVL